MSYETTSESRAKKLEGILTDTSLIEESNNFTNCIEFFKNLILNDLSKLNINYWIAGGSIKDYLMKGYISNDIDIYFSNREDFQKVSDSLINPFGELKEVIFENKNCKKIKYKNLTLDLIKIHSISPEVCISNFDFTICSVALTENKFYHHKNFYNDLKNKKLRSINPNPETIIQRIDKYSKLGFKMDKKEFIFLNKKYNNA